MSKQATSQDVNGWQGFDSEGGRYVAGMARDVSRTIAIDANTLHGLAAQARSLHGQAVKLTKTSRAGAEVKTSAALKTTQAGVPIDWGKLDKPPVLVHLTRLAEAVYIIRKSGAVGPAYLFEIPADSELAKEVIESAATANLAEDAKRNLTK